MRVPTVQERDETLEKVLLQRKLPLEGVEILALENFDEAVETILLSRREPRLIQQGALLPECRLVDSQAPSAARIPHHKLNEEHRHGHLRGGKGMEIGEGTGLDVIPDYTGLDGGCCGCLDFA